MFLKCMQIYFAKKWCHVSVMLCFILHTVGMNVFHVFVNSSRLLGEVKASCKNARVSIEMCGHNAHDIAHGHIIVA